MNTRILRSALIASAAVGLLVVSACSSTDSAAISGATGSSGSAGSGGGKVAFLMPDLASTRYEQQDSPLFTAKMKELCS
ncbi:MAG: ABC transporter substrate-binding protein, partial [Nakamurella sp.]